VRGRGRGREKKRERERKRRLEVLILDGCQPFRQSYLRCLNINLTTFRMSVTSRGPSNKLILVDVHHLIIFIT